MAVHGGCRWPRGIALVLVLASSAFALSACEYQDASPVTSESPDVVSPPAPPPAPKAEPSRVISPPSPSLMPKADPTLAQVQVRNQAHLDSRLGLPPDGLVLGGSGGLGNDGFRSSATDIPKGSYTVTAECVGILKASLTIFQSNPREGTTHQVALDCGTTARARLDLKAGSVSVHITRKTKEPARTAVAGFWIAPAG